MTLKSGGFKILAPKLHRWHYGQVSRTTVWGITKNENRVLGRKWILVEFIKVEILEVFLYQTDIAMTTSAIRKKLINFIADADEKKIKGMYMLFEEEIEKEEAFSLTEEYISIVDEEREKHTNGKSKSYAWQQTKQIIPGKMKL